MVIFDNMSLSIIYISENQTSSHQFAPFDHIAHLDILSCN